MPLVETQIVIRAISTRNQSAVITKLVPGCIWHSDQGKQFGAEQTRHLLLQKGFVLSMSRAGTPTDNGYAERFVGIFKLAVAERYPYHSLGAFLRAAETWVNFSNHYRPHEGLGNLSPQQFAQHFALEKIPLLSSSSVSANRYLTFSNSTHYFE